MSWSFFKVKNKNITKNTAESKKRRGIDAKGAGREPDVTHARPAEAQSKRVGQRLASEVLLRFRLVSLRDQRSQVAERLTVLELLGEGTPAAAAVTPRAGCSEG